MDDSTQKLLDGFSSLLKSYILAFEAMDKRIGNLESAVINLCAVHEKTIEELTKFSAAVLITNELIREQIESSNEKIIH